MRRYTLASPEARTDVDLRDYQELIEATVHEFIPDAVVTVYQTCYTVSPTPEKGDAIRIGRRLSSHQALGRHCIRIPKLFYGEDMEESKSEQHKEEAHGKQKRTGGHQ